MEKSPDRSLKPTGRVGGAYIYGGYLRPIEYNPKLFGVTGVRTYTEMGNHPRIESILSAFNLPLQAADFRIDCEDEKAKMFLEDQLGLSEKSERNFSEILVEVLGFHQYGFSLYEQGWGIKDGMVNLDSFGFRSQETVYEFLVDRNDMFNGVIQYVQGGGRTRTEIPGENLTNFTYRKKGVNYWGRSLLRAAYEPWYALRMLSRLDLIAHQRYAVGVVEGVPLDPEDEPTPAEYDDAEQIAKRLQSGAQTYMIHDGKFKYQVMQQGQQRPTDINGSREHYQLDLLIAVLLAFLEIGTKGVGSYAASETFASMFYNALRYSADLVCDTFTAKVIVPLLEWNHGGRIDAKLVAGEVQPRAAGFISEVLEKLDGYITPDRGIEDIVRRLTGLPALPDDVEAVYEGKTPVLGVVSENEETEETDEPE